MLYRDFKGQQLSALGMGTVRLPITSEYSGDVDLAKTDKIIDTAIQQGINYFDLGWDYHDFKAEEIVGKSLLRYPRDSYYLAAKFPGYHPDTLGRVPEVFETQLRHAGVEYFDFYLLHNVCEATMGVYLSPEYGILPYLLEQKAAGRIRHLGFSTHGSPENIRAFLEAAGQHMEFCMIQLNWLDWEFQRAREKVELLNQWGLPIWVMEPMRGGKLLKLAEEDAAKLKALRPEESIYAWGLRFLQSVPGATVVLSGLSSVEQTEENCRTISEEKPLNSEEWDVLQNIAKGMIEKIILPCTECRYCVSHCPQQLNIPKLLDLYKEQCFTGGGFIAPRAMSAMPKEQQAGACIGCRSCEPACPQGIKISEALADFARKTEAFFNRT